MASEMTKSGSNGGKSDKECSWVEEQAALYVYGELPDEQRHRLEQHVRGCDDCGVELAAYAEMREQLQIAPVAEPSANLLASARLRLDEALDRAEMSGAGRAGRVGWLRQAMSSWSFHLRAVPALATMLVVAGAAGGSVAGWQITRHAQAKAGDARFGDITPDNVGGAAVLTPASASGSNGNAGAAAAAASLPEGIANISGVVTQPGSNLVEVRYNRMVPGEIEGTPDDPKIQQLLLLATQNRVNPGVRVDSVGLLADACHAGHDCEDARVRQALMVALRTDKNAGVRLKALDGLANYVSTDEAVRDSVLQALLHDDNPGVRTQAIQMLSPVEADGSVREVLHTLANDDRNPYIRTVSQQALASGPEIQ